MVFYIRLIPDPDRPGSRPTYTNICIQNICIRFSSTLSLAHFNRVYTVHGPDGTAFGNKGSQGPQTISNRISF